MLLNSLELGIYINIYKTENKRSALKYINELCKKCGLSEYSSEYADKIEEYIRINNDSVFQYFCKSERDYDRFKSSLTNNKNTLFL